MLHDFAQRLTSRKFLLSIAGVITLCANKQYTQAAAVGIGYLVTEGIVDARSVTAASNVEQQAQQRAKELLDALSTTSTASVPEALPVALMSTTSDPLSAGEFLDGEHEAITAARSARPLRSRSSKKRSR